MQAFPQCFQGFPASLYVIFERRGRGNMTISPRFIRIQVSICLLETPPLHLGHLIRPDHRPQLVQDRPEFLRPLIADRHFC